MAKLKLPFEIERPSTDVPAISTDAIQDSNLNKSQQVLNEEFSKKQDSISDLDTIRQNANSGLNASQALSKKADLGDDGKVPSTQLPSYVDDVLEYTNLSSFPTTGETGKIYVALNTNLTYRWSGTTYTEISQSLALGETTSTAYAGNKGKANAEAITDIQSDLGTISNLDTDNKTSLVDAINELLRKLNNTIKMSYEDGILTITKCNGGSLDYVDGTLTI